MFACPVTLPDVWAKPRPLLTAGDGRPPDLEAKMQNAKIVTSSGNNILSLPTSPGHRLTKAA